MQQTMTLMELSLGSPTAQLTHEHLNESNCFKLLDFEAACYTTFLWNRKSSFTFSIPKVLMMWRFHNTGILGKKYSSKGR